MSGGTVAASDLERVSAELRTRERFLLTAHEGPDGDALGSLLGMHHLLTQLGKDSVMFLAAKEFPLPIEYRFLPLEEVFHEPPADMADRTVVFLDCGNIDRMPVDFLTAGGNDVINIDHHHDNTRFGDFNLVDVEASCTAEIVYDLAVLLGARITREMASALYVGLITDTGKFMYENTDAHTHRVAAELIDAGVDIDDTYRRLYEHVPIEKLRLVVRAIDGIQRHCDNRLVLTYITSADYEETGAGEEMTEGVIDHLRSIDGTKVAAVIRDLDNRGRAARKVSLRSSEGDVDVSAIARRHGGGGHKRAAGFSTDLELDALVDFLCGEVTAQLGALTVVDGDSAGAVLLYDKPAGVTSHDVVAKVRRERGCKAGHAGALDPFATGLLLILLGRATRLQRFLVGLRKTYLATARLGWRSSTGDPDGELTETGVVPGSLELPTGVVRQRVPMTSAVRVGGERLYKKAHRGETVATPQRDVEVYRAELLSSGDDLARYEIECSVGTYVRTLVETLGDAYCAELRRTAIGPFGVEDAGIEVEAARVGELVPAVGAALR